MQKFTIRNTSHVSAMVKGVVGGEVVAFELAAGEEREIAVESIHSVDGLVEYAEVVAPAGEDGAGEAIAGVVEQMTGEPAKGEQVADASAGGMLTGAAAREALGVGEQQG